MTLLAQASELPLDAILKFGGASGYTVLLGVLWLLLTGKLVTKRELNKSEAAAERWEQMALRSLHSAEGARENTAKAVSAVETLAATNRSGT